MSDLHALWAHGMDDPLSEGSVAWSLPPPGQVPASPTIGQFRAAELQVLACAGGAVPGAQWLLHVLDVLPEGGERAVDLLHALRGRPASWAQLALLIQSKAAAIDGALALLWPLDGQRLDHFAGGALGVGWGGRKRAVSRGAIGRACGTPGPGLPVGSCRHLPRPPAHRERWEALACLPGLRKSMRAGGPTASGYQAPS